jgi:curved DNA-binding protein CbpA
VRACEYLAMAPGGRTTSEARDSAPFLVPGASFRELTLGPAETFVLACIDGQNTATDIAQTTGLRLEEVARIIEAFVFCGAVSLGDPQSVRQAVRVSGTAKQSGEYPLVRPDMSLPEPPSEMSAEQRERLLDLDRRLGSLDHYQLLGVEPAADAKLVRTQYYELVRTLHPDRYFGKQLGKLENKLLRVFSRITDAYEVLRRQESRAEYDRYLAAKRKTSAFDQQFFDATQQSAEVADALRRIEDAAAAEARNTPVSSVPPPSSAAPASGSGPVRRPSASFALDPDARRRALARKLGHSSLPPPRSPSSPSIPSSRSAEDLKQRYEQRLARAREKQRAHYVTLAEEAAERKDLIAAANALRVACSLAPGDLVLSGDLAEMERRAASELWEAYAERGKYAALEGNSTEAAVSYERAALGHPSAALFERAAFHLVEAAGDLKHAAHLAKQAVSLAPTSAKCRLTLAQVYAAAKLRESALAELERARALEPDSHLIKDWIARVRRGE